MNTALVERPEQPTSVSPMELLQMAVSQRSDIDTIERLAKLANEMMEREAKRRFETAMQSAQSEMRAISTDANNPQTRSRYASYAHVDQAVRPIYAKHGLSVSFDTADALTPDSVMVVAYVSHVDGFTRTYRAPMPADGKGAKGGDVMTKTHAMGAAISYGQRYLLKMIFNLAIGDIDDDGNGASGPRIAEGVLTDWIEHVKEAGSQEELKARFAEAYVAVQKSGDQQALRALIAAKDKRKKEL